LDDCPFAIPQIQNCTIWSICGAYVVGVFGKRFSETSNLFQPHFILEVAHAAAAILDRPRCGCARFFSHGENISSAKQVITVMPKSMAQYVANWQDFARNRWSWSRFGLVIGGFAKFALHWTDRRHNKPYWDSPPTLPNDGVVGLPSAVW
jgi:hypothetical protein